MNCDKQTTQEAAPRVATRRPAYDVAETADNFVVTAQIPGVDRAGVETVIDGDDLVITGTRAWKQPEDWKLLHAEIPAANYRLVLRLDRRVNYETPKANLKDGVLTVTLPKAEEVKPRRIEIAG